jgi:oligoribonuclease NrnB/cAMP/cGMP phosphodiesterase (DHH superfamily)
MTIHITHNDLDGVACAILVKAALKSPIHTIYTDYDHLDDIIENGLAGYDSVIITDIAPSESQLERIAGEKELLLIDHHKSSEHLVKHPFVLHSNEKSATLLSYEKLSSMGHDLSAHEDFALCVNDFDLWQLKRSDSLRMNMLLTLYGLERFEKRFLAEPYLSFKREEVLLIDLEQERRQAYIQNAFKNIRRFTDLEGQKFATVFAESNTSELGNYIIVNADVDYVLIINAQKGSASLRSRKEVDISHIAVRNGGGGHKNAAGFPLKVDFGLDKILKKMGLL